MFIEQEIAPICLNNKRWKRDSPGTKQQGPSMKLGERRLKRSNDPDSLVVVSVRSKVSMILTLCLAEGSCYLQRGEPAFLSVYVILGGLSNKQGETFGA